MSQGLVGANLDELERLATEFDRAAERVTGEVRSVQRSLVGTSWKGPTADRFRGEWNNQHTRRLQQIAEELRTSARELRRNLAEQRQASSALSGDYRTGIVPQTGIDPAIIWAGITGGIAAGKEGAEWMSEVTGALKFFKVPGVGPADTLLGFYKKGANGYEFANDVQSGNVRGAIHGGVSMVGDAVGDTLVEAGVKKGNLPLYLGGVIGREVGMIADLSRDVDLSPNGLYWMTKVTPDQWVDSFVDAAAAMPGRVWDLFKPW